MSDIGGIWMLSYILTPNGREVFSNRINKKVFPSKRNLWSRFVVSKKQKKEYIKDLIDMPLNNVEIPQEPIDYSNEFRAILEPNEIEDDENKEEDYLPWELIEEEELAKLLKNTTDKLYSNKTINKYKKLYNIIKILYKIPNDKILSLKVSLRYKSRIGPLFF